MASSSSKAPVYDLTLSDEEDTPNVTLHGQVIDLTNTEDPASAASELSVLASPGAAPPALPAALVIQPLSLYWKMMINRRMNIYQAGRPVTRPDATVITRSSGLHGEIPLTVGDFRSLTMICDGQGHVNDNIINAFLQTLDQAIRKAAPHLAAPPCHVFLSTYAAHTLEQAANDSTEALQQLQRTLNKHGVTPANSTKVRNIYFPVHIATGSGHWVLAVWHPHRAAMTWFDSLAPITPRARFSEINKYLQLFQHFWIKSTLPPWSARVARCSQQKNGSDCGVYVLATCLFCVLQYDRFVTGQGKQNLLRNYFAAVLIQGGWGGELPWGWPSPTTLPPRHYEQEVTPGSAGYMTSLP